MNMPVFTRCLAALLASAAALAPTAASATTSHQATAQAPAFQPTRFSVVVDGSGPDVILIPGLATSREVWDRTRQELRGRYRLHLVQLNGFGGTPAGANGDAGTLPGVVEELSRYIAANHLRQPAVVGHSMGGLMGLMLAQRHGEQVGRLMIVDSLPFIGLIFDPTSTAETLAPRAAMMRDMLRGRGPATPESAAATPGMSRTAEGRTLVGRLTYQADPAVVAETAYETMSTDLRLQLAAIRTPIRMLYPWDPATVTEEQARALYEGAYRPAPNARLVAVPNSQHFIMIDQPEAFSRELAAFLAEPAAG